MHLKNHRYVIILKFATVVGLVIIESVLQVDGISENARNQRCGISKYTIKQYKSTKKYKPSLPL